MQKISDTVIPSDHNIITFPQFREQLKVWVPENHEIFIKPHLDDIYHSYQILLQIFGSIHSHQRNRVNKFTTLYKESILYFINAVLIKKGIRDIRPEILSILSKYSIGSIVPRKLNLSIHSAQLLVSFLDHERRSALDRFMLDFTTLDPKLFSRRTIINSSYTPLSTEEEFEDQVDRLSHLSSNENLIQLSRSDFQLKIINNLSIYENESALDNIKEILSQKKDIIDRLYEIYLISFLFLQDLTEKNSSTLDNYQIRQRIFIIFFIQTYLSNVLQGVDYGTFFKIIIKSLFDFNEISISDDFGNYIAKQLVDLAIVNDAKRQFISEISRLTKYDQKDLLDKPKADEPFRLNSAELRIKIMQITGLNETNLEIETILRIYDFLFDILELMRSVDKNSISNFGPHSKKFLAYFVYCLLDSNTNGPLSKYTNEIIALISSNEAQAINKVFKSHVFNSAKKILEFIDLKNRMKLRKLLEDFNINVHERLFEVLES